MTDGNSTYASAKAEIMVSIRGGEFAMGSEEFYPDEGPIRRVSVDGFWIDRNQVTNAQFAAFVDEAGYVSEAEKAPDPLMYPGAPVENLVPGALVFRMPSGPVHLGDFTHHRVPVTDRALDRRLDLLAVERGESHHGTASDLGWRRGREIE